MSTAKNREARGGDGLGQLCVPMYIYSEEYSNAAPASHKNFGISFLSL